jgi:hypothetical protein
VILSGSLQGQLFLLFIKPLYIVFAHHNSPVFYILQRHRVLSTTCTLSSQEFLNNRLVCRIISTPCKVFSHLRADDEMASGNRLWFKVDYCFPVVCSSVFANYLTWVRSSTLFCRISIMHMTTFALQRINILCINIKIIARQQ